MLVKMQDEVLAMKSVLALAASSVRIAEQRVPQRH